MSSSTLPSQNEIDVQTSTSVRAEYLGLVSAVPLV